MECGLRPQIKRAHRRWMKGDPIVTLPRILPFLARARFELSLENNIRKPVSTRQVMHPAAGLYSKLLLLLLLYYSQQPQVSTLLLLFIILLYYYIIIYYLLDYYHKHFVCLPSYLFHSTADKYIKRKYRNHLCT